MAEPAFPAFDSRNPRDLRTVSRFEQRFERCFNAAFNGVEAVTHPERFVLAVVRRFQKSA